MVSDSNTQLGITLPSSSPASPWCRASASLPSSVCVLPSSLCSRPTKLRRCSLSICRVLEQRQGQGFQPERQVSEHTRLRTAAHVGMCHPPSQAQGGQAAVKRKGVGW